jgi:signal transduction histidine kinase
MLRQALYRSLVVLGAVAAVAYPALDLATGRGPQWHWLHNESTPLLFFLIGAYVFVRRPDHLVARRLLLAGVSVILAASLGQLLSVAYVKAGLQPWFWFAGALDQAAQGGFLASLLAVFAVYPDGWYQRGYERWMVRVAALLPVVLAVLQLLTLSSLPVNPFFVWAAPPIPSPLHIEAISPLGAAVSVLSNAELTMIVIGAVLLVMRYRRFDAERRLQARWPLFSLLFVIPFGMGPVGFLVGLAGFFPMGPNNGAAAEVALPTLPLALAIGLLRPHLLDLERVIRKSVVYGVLWLLIGFGYMALAAFVGVATTKRYEVGVVVLVTILATIAFQPVRAFVERLASRLVYGERLSGYQAVSRLGSGLEAAAPEQAAAMVAAIVRQALDAKWARVVIAGARPTIAADGLSDGSAAEATLAAQLVSGEEVVGRVECGPRSEGRYRPRDEELLVTLTRHAAVAIRNAALAAELADRLEQINLQATELHASRARIVRAEETGRRRLERDIHDGVQQELVALLAKIRLARNQVGRDPSSVGTLLEELQEETKLALSDLRDLAQGIHPTVLSDRGLVEAIEDRVSRMPASVTVEVADEVRNARFTQAVEGAAYFTVCEGLANAMKHASAQRLTVRLDTQESELCLDISDDGAGFDAQRVSRSGLKGLEDRIEALGGRLQVTSAPGHGTRLLARLPAQAASLA